MRVPSPRLHTVALPIDLNRYRIDSSCEGSLVVDYSLSIMKGARVGTPRSRGAFTMMHPVKGILGGKLIDNQ